MVNELLIMQKERSKTKYRPLFQGSHPDGEILVPGRHACTCEASRHNLINNCRNCGRIVCEQEGSGPCFTCGRLVCSPKEQEKIDRQSKAGKLLYEKLMKQDTGAKESNEKNSLEKALEHRDKLIEYDQTSEKRTKVIDDESDFFQTDSSWLSTKEREILTKKKEEIYSLMHDRKNRKMTFDFSQKKVIEETPRIDFDPDEMLKPDISLFECKNDEEIGIPKDFNPEYRQMKRNRHLLSAPSEKNDLEHFKSVRIQDQELQKMSDEGLCLSLHQPYASLLVAGIKRHEGRTWYTSYCGRLWIHAAGKIPRHEDIVENERFYEKLYGSCNFPKSYPTGCLLGCVDLISCLPQEEYMSSYPEGEIASPYVFICDNARELVCKFPMKGKHKIFKLDSLIHQAAKKALSRSS